MNRRNVGRVETDSSLIETDSTGAATCPAVFHDRGLENFWPNRIVLFAARHELSEARPVLLCGLGGSVLSAVGRVVLRQAVSTRPSASTGNVDPVGRRVQAEVLASTGFCLRASERAGHHSRPVVTD